MTPQYRPAMSRSRPASEHTLRVLGVAIFDMDESEGERSTAEIVNHARDLGINPGGAVSVQEIEQPIPAEYKKRLITDDALLLKLGSSGRKNTNRAVLKRRNAIHDASATKLKTAPATANASQPGRLPARAKTGAVGSWLTLS